METGLLDQLFAKGNRALLTSDFPTAKNCYEELRSVGSHAAVTHNYALLNALAGQADDAMHLLLDNREQYPSYMPSQILAAELHRRAARGNTGAGAKLLEDASEILAAPLRHDPGDPQTCIVASETLAACAGAEQDAIKWHITGLAAIRLRQSKPVTDLAEAYIDDLLDRSIHYYSMPPEEGLTTGSLPVQAIRSGRCLAILKGSWKPVTVPAGWDEVVWVSYSPAPAKTEAGELHVRTPFRWAARFAAARALADKDIHTAVVWDPVSAGWNEKVASGKALVTVGHTTDPMALFCLKPSSELEVRLLQELFRTENVPPVAPTDRMALETFRYLAADSQLDVQPLHEIA